MFCSGKHLLWLGEALVSSVWLRDYWRAEEMAQPAGVLLALTEEKAWVSSTHMLADLL